LARAEIPTIYAVETGQAATFSALPNNGKGSVIVMIDGDGKRIYLYRDGLRECRLSLEPLPSGGFRRTDTGAQYSVVKWCADCHSWMGVDASLNFTHEEHARRLA
jgi:hypothetical protein